MRNGLFSRRRAVLLPVVGFAAIALAGCTSVASVPVSATASSTPSATASSGGSSSTSAPTCADADKAIDRVVPSYPPATDIKAAVGSSQMSRIVQRGRLVVGVSADTRLFGARNPTTNQIEGFDIDMLKAVSTAIFGKVSIEYRVITTAQRVPLLQNGTIDIVARTMTITCERWKQIAFSAEYYRAGQKVLVPVGSEAAKSATPIAALPEKARVCAPKGSTSIERIKEQYKQYTPVEVAVHTQCLVLLQEGKVDAITGDDAILAGFVAQDPYAEVPPQKAFSVEPYGMGISRDNKPLVQIVNAVIQQVVSGPRWREIYQANGLVDALGPGTPPTPQFTRQ